MTVNEKIKMFVESDFIAKKACVFPTYNDANKSVIKIKENKRVRISKIEYDDGMTIVMCCVPKLYLQFVLSLDQLEQSFELTKREEVDEWFE